LFIAGGAFWSGALAKLASVAILDADILRAGDAGRGADVKGDGDGWATGIDIGVPACEDGCRGMDGTNGAESGADGKVGVACGVDAAELALATDIGVGVCSVLDDTGGWW
jgi:hypothetical protein